MPVELPKNVTNEMSEQLSFVSARINLLGKKSDEMNKEIDTRNSEWKKNIEQFNFELSLINNEVDDLKKEFREYMNRIVMIINTFRDSAKKSSFDALNKRIDEMDFENLISREQFERMME